MEMVKTDLDLQLCTLTIAKFDIIKNIIQKRKREINVIANYTFIINNFTMLLKQDHEMAKFGGLWRMHTPMENS